MLMIQVRYLLSRSCVHVLMLKCLTILAEDVRYHRVVVSSGPKLFVYITKVVVQCLQLLWVLLRMELQSHLLMQVLEER